MAGDDSGHTLPVFPDRESIHAVPGRRELLGQEQVFLRELGSEHRRRHCHPLASNPPDLEAQGAESAESCHMRRVLAWVSVSIGPMWPMASDSAYIACSMIIVACVRLESLIELVGNQDDITSTSQLIRVCFSTVLT